MKRFDPTMHKSCPKCGTEMFAIFPDDKMFSLIYRNGTIDSASLEPDLDSSPSDRLGMQCNSKYCLHFEPFSTPLRWSFLAPEHETDSFTVDRDGTVYLQSEDGEVQVSLSRAAISQLYRASIKSIERSRQRAGQGGKA